MKEIDGVKLAKAKNTLKQIHSNILKSLEPAHQSSTSCLPDEIETKKEEKSEPLRSSCDDMIEMVA